MVLFLISYCVSVRELRSGSNQQQVVRLKPVVGETVVNEGNYDDAERLWLLGNRISVDIVHVFLFYKPLSANDDILEWSIMLRAQLGA